MNILSDLGLDSFLGVVSFFLTVGSLALPILLRRRKRQKKNKVNLAGNFVAVADSSKWQRAEAKVLKFAFSSGKVAVAKKQVKEFAAFGPAALVLIVEYADRNGNINQAPLYVGDDIYDEGRIISIKYNLLDKSQVLLAD